MCVWSPTRSPGQVPLLRGDILVVSSKPLQIEQRDFGGVLCAYNGHLTLPHHQRRCVRSSASLRHSGWTYECWTVWPMSLTSQRPSFIHGPTVPTPLCRITSETPYDASVKSWKICVRTLGNFTKVCLGMNSHQTLRPVKVQTFRNYIRRLKFINLPIFQDDLRRNWHGTNWSEFLRRF
jgi:hypothetical protein